MKTIVIGGGFAGVACARTLARRLPRDANQVVLFNKENHMVFHPLLAEVAGASINPEAAAAPLRQMLPGVMCRTEEVRNVLLESSEVEYESHEGQVRRMPYDHVVVACGSMVNLGAVPGMADYSFPLRTVGDAMALRAHVMRQLEKAEVCEDPEIKRFYLSFAVVGGGFSGVEIAGEINDLVRGSRRFFQNIHKDDISVTLIHSRDQILPEVTPALREFARKEMEADGIRMALSARVKAVSEEGVDLGGGKIVPASTVVCTVGSAPSPIVERMEASKEKGRLLTDPSMRIQDVANAWAAGDCAKIINTYDKEPCPPTAQFAQRQGEQIARNILRLLRGATPQPFHFKPLGQLCAIGGKSAVAEILGLRVSGFFAWFLWRGIYLMKLPSWARRTKLALDWTWELLFTRDLGHLQPDRTERVGKAYFQPGEFVFHRGEQARDFYVIEQGHVDVLAPVEPEETAPTIAVLGTGDFFGEMALLSNKPRANSIRARTPVVVVVMGKNLFTRVSRSLAPMRQLLVAAVNRRSSVWQSAPGVREALEHLPLSVFVEPFLEGRLTPHSTLEQALGIFVEKGLDICCVVDDQDRLLGLLTRTDLVRAVERIAAAPLEAGSKVSVESMMVTDPITATLEDQSLSALATMREHGLKRLPVLTSRAEGRLAGYVRVEKIIDMVVRKQHALQHVG